MARWGPSLRQEEGLRRALSTCSQAFNDYLPPSVSKRSHRHRRARATPHTARLQSRAHRHSTVLRSTRCL